MTDPLNDLFWKDEILQIVFWYLGEQLGPTVSAADLRPFLDADPPLLEGFQYVFHEVQAQMRGGNPAPVLSEAF